MAWRIEFDNHQVHDRFDAVIWTDDNRVVARIPQADPVWSDEANARVAAGAELIAAAPDLLAALKEVVAIADRATDEFDRARAAIAKATATASRDSEWGEDSAQQLLERGPR